MKAKLCFVLVLATLGTGCATQAQKMDEEADAWTATLPDPNANYGTYPDNYQELMKAWFQDNLKDPDSAKYSGYTNPIKEHAIENVNAKKVIYGYSACVYVNAKNSYGGYTGKKQYWFFFNNGKILRAKDTSSAFGRIVYRGHPINCAPN